MVPKAHGRANVCAHRKSIKPCNFQNILGAFYSEWYVVVHLCSHFSIRRQMALVQSIKFQTANFPIFRARIIVIFWATCREVFSVIVMGNLTHILQVLHWLEVVIAFVSSLFFYFFFVYNAPEIIVSGDLVALLQQEIALVFLGLFRCCLQRFFGKEYPFQRSERFGNCR